MNLRSSVLNRWTMAFAACASTLALISVPGISAAADAVADKAALQAVPQLDLSTYTGTWYQVAWFPNRFQKQCVSDTTATYSRRADGAVDVLNRCRLADGSFDSANGFARPADSVLEGDLLRPAKLQVSFMPAWLRWLPIWGDYWVVQRPEHGRYAVISEGSRKYLWVLSRTPKLPAEDIGVIRSRLVEQGFDLAAWQTHPQTAAETTVTPVTPVTPFTTDKPDPMPTTTTTDTGQSSTGQARRPATPPASQAR